MDSSAAPTTPAPKESLSLFHRGLIYLHGSSKQKDLHQAAEAFQQGWQAGDPNAGYMLCQCCLSGDGVPRDFDRAFRLAEELVSRGFHPANYLLERMHREGLSVPLSLDKAQEYGDKLLEKCSQPMGDGVEEFVRFEALGLHAILNNTPDCADFVAAMANGPMRELNLPARHTLLAMSSLLRLQNNDPSAEETAAISAALQAGISAAHTGAYFLKSALVGEDPDSIIAGSDNEAAQLARAALQVDPTDVGSWWRLYRNACSQRESETAENNFWEICHLGHSQLARKDELNCRIRLKRNDRAALWNVLPRKMYLRALAEQRPDILFDLTPPRITIENLSNDFLEDVKVRLCSPDSHLDTTLTLAEPLRMGEITTLDPELRGLCMGDKLRVEVRCKGKSSIMVLGTPGGVTDFLLPVPPILLWWERSPVGGCCLHLCNDGRKPLTDIRVAKLDGSIATSGKPFTLAPGQSRRLGWIQFSDTKNLHQDDMVGVYLRGYAPVLGHILRPTEQEFQKAFR